MKPLGLINAYYEENMKLQAKLNSIRFYVENPVSLKDRPAKRMDREFLIFCKLFEWREHEKARRRVK